MTDNLSLAEELAQLLKRKILVKESVIKDELQVEVCLESQELREFCKKIRDDKELQFNLLLSITALDLSCIKHESDAVRFEVIYHLLSLNFRWRLTIRVPVLEAGVPSLTDLWESANFMEREVFDMFGISFDGHPDLRRILMYEEFQGYPLRKDYPFKLRQPRVPEIKKPRENDALKMERPELVRTQNFKQEFNLADEADTGIKNRLQPHRLDDDLHTESTIISFGPSHPATHGTIRIETEVVGERIIDADVEVGYLHRGFEKSAENVTYTQLIPYTDRLNYVSPIINNVGWCLAVEKLLGITVPKRNQYIRVLLSEISRVCDHLTCIGAAAMELGAFSVMLYTMQAREYLWELLEEVTGARLTVSYVRIGSLRYDLPADFVKQMAAAFKKVRKLTAMVDRLLSRNRIFQDRMQHIAVITPEDAVSYGLTGPMLRASGVSYDVRKACPYSSYEDFEFEIPLGSNGDNYDRYMVRMLEIEQSLRIAEQAADNMPAGEIRADDTRIVLPEKEEVYNSIEGEIKHFKILVDGIRPPVGEVYQCVEGGNGELGFYVVSDGSAKPYRVHVRAPSFIAMGIFRKLLIGNEIADLIATFGMMNMIGGECDR